MALERQEVAFASQHADPSLLVMTVPSEMTAGGISIQAFAVPLDARREGAYFWRFLQVCSLQA